MVPQKLWNMPAGVSRSERRKASGGEIQAIPVHYSPYDIFEDAERPPRNRELSSKVDDEDIIDAIKMPRGSIKILLANG